MALLCSTRRPAGGFTTWADIIDDYRRRSGCPQDERNYYASLSFAKALHDAAWAVEGSSGRRSSHQRRIPRACLRAACRKLQLRAKQLRKCASFDELHEAIRGLFPRGSGLGELCHYDTALRLGFNLGLLPAHVYAHAGTRQGARALGLDTTDGFVRRESLPPELRCLPAWQVEDILCIYKRHLARLAGSARR